jgi:hypothetical protein
MTSDVEVKKLLKPILARHEDLRLAGKLLVLSPVNHLARGVYIGRTSRADHFSPVMAINCLFEPKSRFAPTYGADIYPKQKGLWLFSRHNIDEEIADRIGETALSKLRAVETIEDFLHYGLKGRFFASTLEYSHLRKVYIYLALGYLQAAQEILQQFSKESEYWVKMTHTPEHFTELMDIVRPMVQAQDKAGIATKLHEWEAYTVKELKLEKYWQPTPFPIEM